MSISRQTSTNPAKRFFKWSGSKGKLVWWDKEEKTEHEVDFPFIFIPIDSGLSTITGWSDADESGYWSNEIKNISREPLTVRTSKGIVETALYKNLSKSKGAKYAKSMYIIFSDKDTDGYIIGNIKWAGAALGPIIDLGKQYQLEGGKIILKGATEGKKGTNTFYMPELEYDKINNEEFDIAVEIDKELQTYLDQYFNKGEKEVPPETDELPPAEMDVPPELLEEYGGAPAEGYDKPTSAYEDQRNAQGSGYEKAKRTANNIKAVPANE